ncbi:hypothetical protein F4X88_02015 [Candidatus Poribacteria bacterium]|nr:hypothetical protein [Candidatus Poribacteria bacterium]MYA55047.1 hypothetical protein [Candidatus Poribacteria bacterium]
MLKRAMTSTAASYKKRTGHINEQHFAYLIDGDVVGDRTDKTDVIDQSDNTYSVKGGEWWQIFLYGRERFVTNTEFREIGNLADLFIDCIDAFPENRNDYFEDKIYFKKRLQEPMRQLKDEICRPTIFPQLLSKAIFNGNEVGFLSILSKDLSRQDVPLDQKHFHLFSAEDVVRLLSMKLQIENSRARGRGQMDAQKVIFRYSNKNVGEIEIRTDSNVHYKQAKWRFNSPAILSLLQSNFAVIFVENRQTSVYGSAIEYL